ncbi:MAG: hypothetical protein LBE33_06415 [Zoogloeaceae bacterium]|jgi:hypothetical protein|nr:hypothetical protein [Zoogloeaceae bacterium]
MKSLAAASGLGAAQGAVYGTRTDDDSLLTNAAIGATLAPAAELVGAGGSRLIQAGREALAGKAGRAGRVLAEAGSISPEELAARIRAGNIELVPGSMPTTAQAANNQGMSQLERTLVNRNYGPLTEREAAQNAARLAAIDGVAPTSGMTRIEAADLAGDVIGREAAAARDALKGEIRALYNSPELSAASIGIPGRNAVQSVIDQFYPGVPEQYIPKPLLMLAEHPLGGQNVPFNQFDAIRKIIGNAAADSAGTDRTAAAALSSVKSLLNEAEQAALERGQRAFQVTGQGPWGPVYGNLAGDPKNAVAHLLRTGTGEVPGGVSHAQVGQPISLVYGKPGTGASDGYGVSKLERFHPEALEDLQGLLDELRVDPSKSGANRLILNNAADDRGVVSLDWQGDPRTWLLTAFRNDKGPVSGALSGAGKTIDTASIAGEGNHLSTAGRTITQSRDPRQYTGMMSPEAAEFLKTARRMYGEEMGRFNTGPSMGMFREGADNLPQIQGGEIPGRFFNSRASQSADMDQFLRMLPGETEAKDALARYAIADALESATNQGGELSAAKYGNWLNRRSSAIEKLFGPEDVNWLRLAQRDMDRATDAENLGRAAGSNTAQNLEGSKLLNSRLTELLFGSIPLVNKFTGPLLGAARMGARDRATQEVGEAMLDPNIAARYLDMAKRIMTPTPTQQGLRYLPATIVPGTSRVGAGE